MLEQIGELLTKRGLVSASWVSEMTKRGQMVKLYRDYYAGEHRLKLTAEMKKMMQISDGNAAFDRYNANYCEMVINTMADRLTVEGIEPLALTPLTPQADAPLRVPTNDLAADPAQAWGDRLAQVNRFDGLQNAVQAATLRDGETFVMEQYDDAAGYTKLFHELAWDNDTGTMVIYDRQGRAIQAAVKVWYEGDEKRVNIYFPESTEKYAAGDGGLQLLGEVEVTTRNGRVPGVPVVHFVNKGSKLKPESELLNVIPLQDSLNRTLVSMVMNAELTAFSILLAIGWKPPSGLTPGMILHAQIAGEDGTPATPETEEQARAFATLLSSFRLERIEGGDLSQLISQAEFLIGQIGVITSTPIPSTMGGDSQSGEALKQRDIRLLGKLNRCMVSMGNAWEDVWALAGRIQDVFGVNQSPAVAGWSTRWKSAEIRNDADILAAAKQLHEWGYERAALRLLSQSSLASFSDAEINDMMAEKARDNAAVLTQAAASLPGFGNFTAPAA